MQLEKEGKGVFIKATKGKYYLIADRNYISSIQKIVSLTPGKRQSKLQTFRTLDCTSITTIYCDECAKKVEQMQERENAKYRMRKFRQRKGDKQ